MHSPTLWKSASRPNYVTNIDREYPYSEVPYLGQYNLVKLPENPNERIDHVDYWGEGRIVTQHGVSGFTNCYNVNHTYQLVSNGPDRDKKIPNRIPVLSYTDCNTSAYLRDNSVSTVTVMGSPINTSCAKDIARIINKDIGKVILYGFETNSADVQNITTKLAEKSIYHYSRGSIPPQFRGLSLFDKQMIFTNVTVLKEELHTHVINGNYDDAVDITKKLDNSRDNFIIKELVNKLLSSNTSDRYKLMSFAYKLWNNGGQNAVRVYFPTPFKLIFGQEKVIMLNRGYNQAIKLDVHLDSWDDRLAWGDDATNSYRVSWKFIPIWSGNEVTFKLYNFDCNMYLKLDVHRDSLGDRQAWGSSNSDEDRHRYYVEPYMRNGSLMFYIINYKYSQGLKLDATDDSYGDRLLWGHDGDIYAGEARFEWTISAWHS